MKGYLGASETPVLGLSLPASSAFDRGAPLVALASSGGNVAARMIARATTMESRGTGFWTALLFTGKGFARKKS